MLCVKGIGTKMKKKGPGVQIFKVTTISRLLSCQILLSCLVSSVVLEEQAYAWWCFPLIDEVEC